MVQHATLDDLEEIKSIFNHHRKWFPHVRYDYLKGQIINGGCIFEEGVVITYNLYKKRTKLGSVVFDKGDCILHQIVATHQGDGSASNVFTKFIDHVDTNIVLTVRSENERAIGFYEKMGMEQVCSVSWKQGEIDGALFLLPKTSLASFMD